MSFGTDGPLGDATHAPSSNNIGRALIRGFRFPSHQEQRVPSQGRKYLLKYKWSAIQ